MIELSYKPYDVVDFELLTAPTTTVISMQDAKDFLRVDGDQEDVLIYALLQAATDAAEAYTWLQSNTATFKSYLTCLPRYIKFWKNPISAITHIKYYDENNDLQTLDTDKYSFSTIHGCGVICIAESIATYDRLDAVEIQFVAGFGSNTPARFISAVKLTLGHLYEHREAVSMTTAVELPMGVQYLLDMIKIKRI